MFFRISYFVFSIRKKAIWVWNDMWVSKWWQIFILNVLGGKLSRSREDMKIWIMTENVEFCLIFFVSKIFSSLFSFLSLGMCVFVDTSLNCSSERWNPKPLNRCLHRNAAEAALKSPWQSRPEIFISPPSPPVFPRSTQLSPRHPDNPFSWDRY